MVDCTNDREFLVKGGGTNFNVLLASNYGRTVSKKLAMSILDLSILLGVLNKRVCCTLIRENLVIYYLEPVGDEVGKPWGTFTDVEGVKHSICSERALVLRDDGTYLSNIEDSDIEFIREVLNVQPV